MDCLAESPRVLDTTVHAPVANNDLKAPRFLFVGNRPQQMAYNRARFIYRNVHYL